MRGDMCEKRGDGSVVRQVWWRGGSDNRTTEHYRHLGTVSTRRRGLFCLILKFSFLCIANRSLHPLDIHLGFEYLSFRSFVWLALAPSRLHDSLLLFQRLLVAVFEILLIVRLMFRLGLVVGMWRR